MKRQPMMALMRVWQRPRNQRKKTTLRLECRFRRSMETVGFLGMAVDMAYSVYNGATIQSVTVKASKGVKKNPGKGSVTGAYGCADSPNGSIDNMSSKGKGAWHEHMSPY